MNIKDDFILSQIDEGYLVGGAVRDFLMRKISFDRDIAIKGAEGFSKKIAEKFGGTLIILDNENLIFRVVLPDKVNYLDISEIQGETIEEDLKRRDFTVNAIAYDLKNNVFIDVTGGIEDIKNKKINYIREENFEEDSLRVLRAYRFIATTGFEVDEKFIATIKKYIPQALRPAKERIHYEIMKLFGGDYASMALLMANDIGFLGMLFPFVEELKKVPSNSHHHLDLFHHSVETVRQIEILYKNSSEEVKKHLESADFGGFARLNHIKIAAFMHDIGKFSTWTIEEGGRHRFIKHDDVGSKLCVQYLKELKFSKKQIEYISDMVKNHIYPSSVCQSPELSEKIFMRYIRKMGANVIDNIILAKADRLSARGVEVTEQIVNENLNNLEKLQTFYLEKRETLKPLPKLLDGVEIMKLKNIQQSPKLGEIIRALHEAQLNGDVNTIDEAKEFVINF